MTPQEVKGLLPIVNIPDDIRQPVMGATHQPRAALVKYDHVSGAYVRKAAVMGVSEVLFDLEGIHRDGAAEPEPSALREPALQHLADELVTAGVTGDNTVAFREALFATMVSVRATPGPSAHDSRGARLRVGLPTAGRESCGQPDDLAVCGFLPTNSWQSLSGITQRCLKP